MNGDTEISKAELLRYFMGDSRLGPEEARIGAWVHAQYSSVPFLREGETHSPIDWDTEAELRELEAKIDAGSAFRDAESRSSSRPPRERPARQRKHKKNTTWRSTKSRFARAMVVLALMAVSALAALSFWGDREDAPALAVREVTTDRGQQAQIRLADGTEVMLSVDSKLRIPPDLNASDGARDVALEGEAYFEVASNPNRPFRVHAGGSVSRVLGTAFSVRAYPGEGNAHVAVAEGSVAVGADQQTGEGDVVLTRNQVGRWSQRRPDAVQVDRKVDLDRYLEWREGRLTFDGTPLDDVIAKMERWYDLDIQLTDPSLQARTFTGTFNDSTPVTEVLDTFTLATGLQYDKDGQSVVLRPATE